MSANAASPAYPNPGPRYGRFGGLRRGFKIVPKTLHCLNSRLELKHLTSVLCHSESYTL